MMERLLQGIPGVVPYFDDVLISGDSKAQLFERLRLALQRFQTKGLRVRRDKCIIGVQEVEFLGYLIDGTGIHPTKEKVKAIHEAPAPKNKGELQAFLGLLNFYSLFLRQKATVAEPLHRLLGKAATWKWGREEEAAFKAIKNLLSSDSVLMQYHETLPLLLTCDASPYGVGAVLSHQLPNGSEAPIAFFSKTMSSAERNYSQLDKEALAIVAGTKRFHEYLYGRRFSIITDHKPLLGLLAGDKPTPPYMSPRMTRWAIFLAGYSYTLIHRPGKSICNADALSRCPTAEGVEDPAPTLGLFHIDVDQQCPVTSADVAAHTQRDKTLKQVKSWILRGWPTEAVGADFTPFVRKQQELSTMKGCLLWGDRVVIPRALQRRTLEALHNGHPGIVKMKALARSYVWWQTLDKDIEEWVARCDPCQETRPAPPQAQPSQWEAPSTPWSRVHIDFAGPIEGKSLLIAVDAFSKWLEVVLMPTTTTEATIKALRRLFATHGLPDVIVSDNGPQLTSKAMESFLAGLGIRHALIAPYRPAGNGQAERMVRLTKEALAKMGAGDWQEKIDNFLLTQHITPHATTQKSPAELLMGRRLRSPLDRLHPQYNPEVPGDASNPPRRLAIGDPVFVLNFRGDPKWLKGRVEEITGPKSYWVELEDGQVCRRHIDQLRKRWRGVGRNQVSEGSQNHPDEAALQHPSEVDLQPTSRVGRQQQGKWGPQHPDEVGSPHPDEVDLPPPSEVGRQRRSELALQHPVEVGLPQPYEVVLRRPGGAGRRHPGEAGQQQQPREVVHPDGESQRPEKTTDASRSIMGDNNPPGEEDPHHSVEVDLHQPGKVGQRARAEQRQPNRRDPRPPEAEGHHQPGEGGHSPTKRADRQQPCKGGQQQPSEADQHPTGQVGQHHPDQGGATIPGRATQQGATQGRATYCSRSEQQPGKVGPGYQQRQRGAQPGRPDPPTVQADPAVRRKTKVLPGTRGSPASPHDYRSQGGPASEAGEATGEPAHSTARLQQVPGQIAGEPTDPSSLEKDRTSNDLRRSSRSVQRPAYLRDYVCYCDSE